MSCSIPSPATRRPPTRSLSSALAALPLLVIAPALHAQAASPDVHQADTTRPRVYFESQVERQVQPAGAQPAPRYPATMRTAGASGKVIAQFIVDSAGNADMSSFKVLEADHADFAESVRELVPQMRFRPAEIRGRPVHQLVQMPVVFAIDPGPTQPVQASAAEAPAVEPSPDATTTEQPSSAQPAGDDSIVYDEIQVDKKVAPAAGNRAPRYPEGLRNAGIQGEVIVQFIVTAKGRMLPGSFRVQNAAHPEFVDSVREALRGFRFLPAEVQGRKVSQMVVMPFVFGLQYR